MGLFRTYKAYALYFPTGVSPRTAGHELAAATGITSLKKQSATATVRWILGQDGLSNFRSRSSCELNEQSSIRIDSHVLGKPDSREYWSGTCTPKSAINAFTRHSMGQFRVRSTTGNISIYFGAPSSAGGTSSFGLASLAKGFVPGTEGIRQIYGLAEGARNAFKIAGRAIDSQKIVFYMEALQGIGATLSISCPTEGVTCDEIAGHLNKLHNFPVHASDPNDYKD